jgi:Mg2+ and Co2+ transporters
MQQPIPASPLNPPCVINCAWYDDRGGRRHIALDDIDEYLAREDGFVWVGLYEPDDAVLAIVQREFGLHELAIEDTRKATSDPRPSTTATRCSWWCIPRRWSRSASATARPTPSSARAS